MADLRHGPCDMASTMQERDPCRDSTTILGWRKLLRSLGGDRRALWKLAQMFLEESPRQLEDMRDALARGDTCALEQVAHRLKGTAGYFAADGTLAAAARLEIIARSRDLDGADEACAKLEREIVRLTRALAGFDPQSKRASRPTRVALARR